eukprot:scaffold116144_cov33-Prasinocladus_malaysianus.AAC.1
MSFHFISTWLETKACILISERFLINIHVKGSQRLPCRVLFCSFLALHMSKLTKSNKHAKPYHGTMASLGINPSDSALAWAGLALDPPILLAATTATAPCSARAERPATR